MCGIAGIYNWAGERVNRHLLEKMADVLNHRGPDDVGFHVGDKISLAHKRLSIIDLNTGHQPIYNETGDVCIVFNGEIYNFLELRPELEKKDTTLKPRQILKLLFIYMKNMAMIV